MNPVLFQTKSDLVRSALEPRRLAIANPVLSFMSPSVSLLRLPVPPSLFCTQAMGTEGESICFQFAAATCSPEF